jgi:hypothetical protein
MRESVPATVAAGANVKAFEPGPLVAVLQPAVV